MNGRTILAVILLSGGIAVAVAGASPQSALTPSDAYEAGAGDATVKGMVAAVDAENRSFVLTDGERSLEVRMSGQLPAPVQEGRSLVAKGHLIATGGDLVLQADEILVGCPSKYQA